MAHRRNESEKKMRKRFEAGDLKSFCGRVLHRVGMDERRSSAVADILVEGDLWGHSSHGVKLLGPYAKEIEYGTMTLSGDPRVVADSGSALTLDGRYLPGPWLVLHAMDMAFERSTRHPVVTVVIRRCHHIACLAAFMKRATDRKLLCILTCSDPNFKSVAPFGGTTPTYSPNPLAAGIPTSGDPVVLDMSVSNTANGVIARFRSRNKKLPGKWLIDNRGVPTDDPEVMYSDPPGTILPLGGMDLGYKGFALGLLIEALTSALGGYGRADGAPHWGSSVFLQVINPGMFGGYEAFVRETGFFAEACRKGGRIDASREIRMPGHRGLKLREKQLREGVELEPDVLSSLEEVSARYEEPLPSPIEQQDP